MRILLRQPVAHSVLVARNARSNGGDFVALLPQNTDGNSLLLAEVAVGMWVVIEERGRRRRRMRKSDCCSCSGRVAALMIAHSAQMMPVSLLCGVGGAALLAWALSVNTVTQVHPADTAHKHSSA